MSLPQLVLDEALVKTATDGVINAFANLFGVTPTAGAHTIEKDFVSKGDISGILGMIQESVEATLVVSFQKQTIFGLLEKMYGMPFTAVDNSVKQGVGELTNIIYAGMKRDLNEKGHKFKMSIPTVVIGAGHSVYNIHEGRTLLIPFHTEAGDFYVEITLQSS